ncbi:endonuclease domain-containing protein [Sphingosinicella sp. BN140058]|uniref:endonuclease domain-containing protein n=1 Tax=Sphingosinicella sp. BN140058 TaxID=1892855 RepID=UPI0010116952|nr:endonuclease domain-containing protein [Sphingosinicella sp. BN140058]QAY79378.1 endonuclease domain-containing protein [Sphingosinicella sp. BN140058]
MVVFKKRLTLRAQQLRRTATEAEQKLWTGLRQRQLGGFKFSRQMPIGPFICEFLCRETRLVIEVDGGQHDDQAAADASSTRYLVSKGSRVIRFWNHDVLGNTDGVLSVILEALTSAPPPTPPASGRGAETARPYMPQQ